MGEWVRAKACSSHTCIEVKNHGRAIEIHEDLLSIYVSHEDWRLFVEGIKNGDFDEVLP